MSLRVSFQSINMLIQQRFREKFLWEIQKLVERFLHLGKVKSDPLKPEEKSKTPSCQIPTSGIVPTDQRETLQLLASH